MTVIAFIAYALLGVVAGVLSGLLGISGGIITIPCLLLIFHLSGLHPDYLMQLAIGTSLAAMVFNTFTSILSHHMHRRVIWKIAKNMMMGIIIGCILGSYLGHILPTAVLQIFFALFLMAVGIYFFRGKEVHQEEPSLPSSSVLNLFGFGIGAVSNLLGIGGGVLAIPVLVAYNVTTKKAIGTSSVLAFTITLIGAICYLLFGLGQSHYEDTVGYIYLPAFTVIAVTSFFSAPLGAYLTHKVSASKLKKGVAVALVAIGLSMLLRH